MTWNFQGEHNKVYLTFDDGPTPKVTPQVLDLLSQHKAKATFFCLGRNVDAFPEIYLQILKEGHSVGNHSYSHLKGFRSSVKRYVEDVNLARTLIDSPLFRPPYGRILPQQVKAVINNYKIIMWDVLSVDYNHKLSCKRVVRNVTRNVRPGSIIVFHDSDKARKNLYGALPEVLGYLTDKGYQMEAIPMYK